MEKLLQEEQIQKHLTIDEIMPTWSEYLDLLVQDIEVAISFKTQNELLFLEPDRCCVGESWKWKDDYACYNKKLFCDICDGFSFGKKDVTGVEGFGNLLGSIQSGEIGKNWRETSTVKAFVKHFNEVHIKT